jgi:hypothetical protein
MLKRAKHNNEFLSLNDKKSLNSGYDSKKSFNSKSIDYTHSRTKQKSDFLFDNEEENNPNYWYRGELMQLVQDPLQELLNNSEVVVEQKIELMEILTGCETENRYNIYLLDKNKTKKFLFKCKEISSWCCRNCIASKNRSFVMDMIHYKSSNKNSDYKKTIVEFNRPFKCTCCCCARPEMIAHNHMDSELTPMNVKVKKKSNKQQHSEISEKTQTQQEHRKNEGEKQFMGKVVEMYSCNPQLSVIGENGEVRWKIKGDYCQCGFCFRGFSLGKCYEVDFWIYDAQSDPTNSKPVGNIHKVFKGLSELISDSDAFILTFPKKATAFERLLLIASVIMIDFRYFESIACCDCNLL